MKRLFRTSQPSVLRRRFTFRGVAAGLMIASGLIFGCSKESVQGFADKVKDKGESLVSEGKKAADSLVETAKEQLPETGEITLQLAQPVKLDAAIVQMHEIGDGRKNSLQITSYEPGEVAIKGPSLFLQSSTDIGTVALAAGKTVPCVAFFDPGSNAPLARSPLDKPIDVTFGSMNMQAKTIEATFKACTLVGTDGQPVAIGGGTILALVRD